MKELIESRECIKALKKENRELKLINLDKDKTIEALRDRIDELEKDLEYSNMNGGNKRLVLKKAA